MQPPGTGVEQDENRNAELPRRGKAQQRPLGPPPQTAEGVHTRATRKVSPRNQTQEPPCIQGGGKSGEKSYTLQARQAWNPQGSASPPLSAPPSRGKSLLKQLPIQGASQGGRASYAPPPARLSWSPPLSPPQRGKSMSAMLPAAREHLAGLEVRPVWAGQVRLYLVWESPPLLSRECLPLPPGILPRPARACLCQIGVHPVRAGTGLALPGGKWALCLNWQCLLDPAGFCCPGSYP